MTTTQQLAEWIEVALAHPQVVEDTCCGFKYPCSDDAERRKKRMYVNYGTDDEKQAWQNKAVPARKEGFDEFKNAAAADVFAHALIGKFSGDIEMAWWLYRGCELREVKAQSYSREVRLLVITNELAEFLDGAQRGRTIVEIVDQLRSGHFG